MAAQAESANCMTVIVGRKASATGRVLLGHNEDDPGRLIVRHGYVPPREHDTSELIPGEAGRARIPQAARTFGFYWSEVCSAEKGLSASDLMINDNGVCVVSNNGCGSREDGPDEALLREGGIAFNVRRIVAERAGSAREGAAIIRDLASEWGYALSSRIYTVADEKEAFVVQLMRGHRWLSARLPDDAVAAIPNHYVIRSRQDADEVLYSPDLVSYAVGRGWAASEEAFDFYEAYQSRECFNDPINTLRQDYALRLLTGKAFDRARLPFAVPAQRLYTAGDVMDALSCHYEGTSDDLRFGPGASPHNTPIVRVCRGSTIESTVVEFAGAPEETTAWTSFGRPCQQLSLPLHPLCGTVDAIDRMADPAATLESHLSANSDMSWQDSGWQAFRDFGNMAEFFHASCEDDLRALRKAWYAERTRANRERTEPARQFDIRQAEDGLAAIRQFAERHFCRVRVSAAVSQDGQRCVVDFDCAETPRETSLLFGIGGLNLRTQYARVLPGSLTAFGGGRFRAEFPLADVFCVDTGKGRFECFLGGSMAGGRSFAGMAFLERA